MNNPMSAGNNPGRHIPTAACAAGEHVSTETIPTLEQRLMGRYLSLAAESFLQLVPQLVNALKAFEEVFGPIACIQSEPAVANLYQQIANVILHLRTLLSPAEGPVNAAAHENKYCKDSVNVLSQRLALLLSASEELALLIHDQVDRLRDSSFLANADSDDGLGSTSCFDSELLEDVTEYLRDADKTLRNLLSSRFARARAINSLFLPPDHEGRASTLYRILAALKGPDIFLSESSNDQELAPGAEYRAVATVALIIDLARRFQHDIAVWPEFTVDNLGRLLRTDGSCAGIERAAWLAWSTQATPLTIDVRPSANGMDVSFSLPQEVAEDARISDHIRRLGHDLNEVTKTTAISKTQGKAIRLTYHAEVPEVQESQLSNAPFDFIDGVPSEEQLPDIVFSVSASTPNCESHLSIAFDRKLFSLPELCARIADQLDKVCSIATAAGGTSIRFDYARISDTEDGFVAKIVPKAPKPTADIRRAEDLHSFNEVCDHIEARVRIGRGAEPTAPDLLQDGPYLILPSGILEDTELSKHLFEIGDAAPITFFDITELWEETSKGQQTANTLMNSIVREVRNLRSSLPEDAPLALDIKEGFTCTPDAVELRIIFTDDRQDLRAGAWIFVDRSGEITKIFEFIMPDELMAHFVDEICSFFDQRSSEGPRTASALISHLEGRGYIIDTKLAFGFERAQQGRSGPLNRLEINTIIRETIMDWREGYALRPCKNGERLVLQSSRSYNSR